MRKTGKIMFAWRYQFCAISQAAVLNGGVPGGPGEGVAEEPGGGWGAELRDHSPAGPARGGPAKLQETHQ